VKLVAVMVQILHEIDTAGFSTASATARAEELFKKDA
jgi:hypothetical protein